MHRVVLPAALAVAFLIVTGCSRKTRLPDYAAPAEASPEGAAPARVREGSLTIGAPGLDRASYTPPPFALDRVGRGYPYRRVDRRLLRRDAEGMEDRTLRTVVLENEYLKVTLLPELGGRVFEAVFKPTGKQVFYRADRLRTFSLYGLGKGWMFATGGLRFEFPTWGHDPNTEEPWEAELRTWPGGSATASFARTDLRTHLKARVHVSLDPGRSWIRINGEIENPNDHPEEGSFWVITGLAGRPGVEFVMPTELVLEHGGEQTDRWPVSDGADWTYFRDWPHMRSFFALDWNSPFSGLYDHDVDAGVVRCADPAGTPGLKLWGAPRMDDYYVSLYGGLTQTMEEKLKLAPGELRRWEEVWYPLVGTKGLTVASREVAVSLHTDDGRLVMGMQPTRVHRRARVCVSRGGAALFDRTLDLTPAGALVEAVDLGGADATLTVRITSAEGRVLLDCALPVKDIRPVFRETSTER